MEILQPTRVSHSYTQQLAGGPAEVFPLLCPVREREWVSGWDPGLVISSSGVAELGCIFTTPGAAGESLWVVTRYAPPLHISFLKVTTGDTVTGIDIVLAPQASGATSARVTYTVTALSERGEQTVRAFTGEYYQEFMRWWERELNHFLRTGVKLPGQTAS